MDMKRKIKFDKKEHWSCTTFYKIYKKEDGKKYLSITGEFDRKDLGEQYLSWIKYNIPKNEMSLEYLLEWGQSEIDYQIAMALGDNYREDFLNLDVSFAYELVNKEMRGESGDGRYKLYITHVDEDTECGEYYY